ncbi:MAG: DUF3365 domain-containing protein [bacterium]|nr:DUF3365 domain-containing protein [bacterium]
MAEDLIYIQWGDSTANPTSIDTSYQTYRVHRVFCPGRNGQETRSHLTSKNPIHPEHEPDSWESTALDLFAQGAREYSTKTIVNNEPHLRYMQPLITKEDCFGCHSGQGYTAGKIGGGISVEIPLGEFTAAASARLQPLMVAHLLLWLFGVTMLSIGAWHSGRRERLRIETLSSLKRK